MNSLKHWQKNWIHILQNWYKWMPPLYRRRRCCPVTLLPHCSRAAAALPPPLCQRCHPAPAANTVLQMSCFRRDAAVLLLLTLPDEQTKTQTWGCNAVKLTHIKLSCYFIRTVIDGNWIGGTAIGRVRYCYCQSWFTIQWQMNGRERRTSGTLHYSKITDRYDWEDDSWGSFQKKGYDRDDNSGVI